MYTYLKIKGSTLKYPKRRNWQWLHPVSSLDGSPLGCYACSGSRCASQSRSGPGGGRTETAGPPGTRPRCASYPDYRLPPGNPVQSSSHPEGERYERGQHDHIERETRHRFIQYANLVKGQRSKHHLLLFWVVLKRDISPSAAAGQGPCTHPSELRKTYRKHQCKQMTLLENRQSTKPLEMWMEKWRSYPAYQLIWFDLI